MSRIQLIFVCFLISLLSLPLTAQAVPNPTSALDDLLGGDPMEDLNLSVSDLYTELAPVKTIEERVFLYPKIGEHYMNLLPAKIYDDFAFFEQDILLGNTNMLTDATEDQRLQDQANQILVAGYGLSGLSKSCYLWPKGIIPYTIDESLDADKEIIFDAIMEWNEKTNITMVHYEREKDFLESEFKNYKKLWRIHFMNTNGRSCFSFVGLRKTTQYTNKDYHQVISLSPGASYRTPLHEIGHAIGLWHEHNRPDRDNYLTINRENIQDEHADQYDLGTNNSGTMVGDYDYESIMHYRDDCFNIDGKQTFSAPAYPGSQYHIGRVNQLSQGDIDSVNAMYTASVWHPGEYKPPFDDEKEDTTTDATVAPVTGGSSSGNSSTTKPVTRRRKRTDFTDEEKKLYGGLVAKRLPANRPAKYKNIHSIECKIDGSSGMSLIKCSLTLSNPDNPSDTITYVGVIHNNGTEPYVMYVKKQ